MTMGICDSSITYRKKVESICKRVITKTNIDCEIIQFSNGEECLDAAKNIDLLLLDTTLPVKNGIEVKDDLLRRNYSTIFIYLSNQEERIKEAFGINVFGFIKKDDVEVRLEKVLNQVFLHMFQFILIDGYIDSRNVLYIKAERVYSRVILRGGKEDLIRKSLRDFERELSRFGFLRVHKSFLINLNWVDHIKSSEVLIQNYKVPVSIRRFNQVKQSYQIFLKTRIVKDNTLVT